MFEPGDAWFRTGDLMRHGRARLLLFRRPHRRHLPLEGRERLDRRGRRRAVAASGRRRRRCVYGVAVPGHEAAPAWPRWCVGADFDSAASARIVAGALPAYARPLFLRLLPALDRTGTFKPTKHELARDGFDPAAVADPLLVSDGAAQAYVPLDAAAHERIARGDWRFY